MTTCDDHVTIVDFMIWFRFCILQKMPFSDGYHTPGGYTERKKGRKYEVTRGKKTKNNITVRLNQSMADVLQLFASH